MVLDDGGLVLHSPIAFTEALRAEVATFGPIRALVAPNLFHHLHLAAWQQAFPEALTFAPAKLQRKRPDLRVDHELGPAFDERFGTEIQRIAVEGMPAVREHLFYHRATKTLVVTDLCFWLPSARGITRAYAKINGVLHRPNASLLFRLAIRDKVAFQKSVSPVYGLDVAQIFMCHDEIWREDASERLREFLGGLEIPVD